MLKITLVRHGNTDSNSNGLIQGHLATELNKSGLAQAKLCGKRLKKEKFNHVYCSDLKRCKQTAEAIIYHHNQLSIEYQSGLRDAGYGELSGLPIKVLSQKSREQHASINKVVVDHGGEDIVEFGKRVLKTYLRIVQDARERKYESILIVTHSGPLRTLAEYWLQKNYKTVDTEITSGPHGNTAVTIVGVEEEGDGFIYQFNSISHLDPKIKHIPPPAV